MLAADAQVQAGARGAATLHRNLDQLAHAAHIQLLRWWRGWVHGEGVAGRVDTCRLWAGAATSSRGGGGRWASLVRRSCPRAAHTPAIAAAAAAHLEGVCGQDALALVERQELGLGVVAGEAAGHLWAGGRGREVVWAGEVRRRAGGRARRSGGPDQRPAPHAASPNPGAMHPDAH